MAKLTGPLLSISATKSIARTVTYYRSRGQDIARQRVDPAQPRTTDQVAQRTLFSAAVALGVLLLTAYKGLWKGEAIAAGRAETWLSRAVRAGLNTGYLATASAGVEALTVAVYNAATGLAIAATLAPKVVTVAVYFEDTLLGVSTATFGAGTYTVASFMTPYPTADRVRVLLDGELIGTNAI